MGEALKKAVDSTPTTKKDSLTGTRVPLRVIDGGLGKEVGSRESVKSGDVPVPPEKTETSAAEGRLASAFRSAGETAKRWGRQALIAVDGYRVNVATKSLDGYNADMATARSSGDVATEAKLAGQIASQLGEIQRLSDRRQANAAEIKKYYDTKLQLPNKNIANGEKLLKGETVDEKRTLGLNDKIQVSKDYIQAWTERKDELSAEFAKVLNASQLKPAEQAKKAELISKELQGIADDIAHEQGNLEAKQNFAKSIQDRINANKATYASQYAKLNKYSETSQDGRSGTEAGKLRKRQEEAVTVKEIESTATAAVEVPRPTPTEAAPVHAETVSNTGLELTDEELENGLQELRMELLGEKIKAVLEKIVTDVGGKKMNQAEISQEDFIGFWKQAREKTRELPELKPEHIKKLDDKKRTLAEFGTQLFLNEEKDFPREVLEKGVKASAEKWIELSKKKKAA